MFPVQNWLSRMREIWLDKNPDAIAALLSTDFRYFESPLAGPLTTAKDVVQAWQDIKSQEIELVEIEILHETPTIGMATWRFKEKGKPLHVGSYFLELDDKGLCKTFRQWWNVAP